MKELCRPIITLNATRNVEGFWGVWGLLAIGGELTNEASRITTLNTLHYEDHENQVIQYLTGIAALLFQLIPPSSINIKVYMNFALKVTIGADFC